MTPVPFDLPVASPGSVGLCPTRLARLLATLNDEIARGKLPGGVVMVSRHGKVACFEALGRLDPERSLPMPKDAIFRIYSMTKPLVSVAAMMLVEQGRLLLGQPVATVLPALASLKVAAPEQAGGLAPLSRPITVQDLLRHTAGFTYEFMGGGPVHRQYAESRLFGRGQASADFCTALAAIPLLRQPGSAWVYSHATDVLGRLIEVLTGQTLGEHLQQAIFGPLGMVDTGFHVPEAQHHRIAEPFRRDPDTGAPVQVFDVREPVPHEMAGAGLASTAADYARFMQMMLGGGALGDTRLLSRKSVELMTSDHLGDIPVSGDLVTTGYGFGLGFAVRLQSGIVPGAGSAGLYYWGGMAGTSFFVDPKEGLYAQFMIQQPGRRDYYRALFRELVYAAIAD